MIQLYHVYMRYPNGIEALNDVNLRIAEGEFVFLTGASGAGKTTLVKILLAYERASSGQVLVNGRNLGVLRASSVPYLRRNIGVVWQDFKLLTTRTVFDNVAISLEILGLRPREIQRRVNQILEVVGLEKYVASKPLQLSGGEQQRVAIARALVNEPAILLADEPTGNLDPDLSVEIMNLLLDLQQKGTTVMVATHDKFLLDRYSRRTLLLNRGFLVEDSGGGAVSAAGPASLLDADDEERAPSSRQR